MKDNRKYHYIIIILATIIVRAGFMVWAWSGWYVYPPSVQSREYFVQGYCIAAGYGYLATPLDKPVRELCDHMSREHGQVTPEMAHLLTEGAIPNTYHPPGMALLVAGINLLFGMKADWVIQILGIILDTIAVVMVYWIAAVSFNARIGLVAGLLYAIFPPLAWAAIAEEPNGLIGAFVIASFFCLLKSTRVKDWSRWGWLAGSGLVLGLGSYLRPDYILMPVFIGFGLWAYTRRCVNSIATMALIQVIVFMTLLPWAYRNHNLTGRWVFSSTMVGAVLITGLGEFSNPWGFGHTDEDRHAQAATQGLKSAWISEADLYFRDLFFRSIKENPGAYLKTILLRAPLALAPPFITGFANPQKKKGFAELQYGEKDRYQIIISRPVYVLAAYFDYLIISGFSLCCLFSVIVLFVKEWSHKGLIFFLLCPHFYSILSHSLIHMEPRFLLPTMYCWLIALAYVLTRGWET